MNSTSSNTSFDPAATFVRVVKARDDGFVEFEFAVGEPSLFVEMIMPRKAFEEFCVASQAKLIDPEVRAQGSIPDWEWRLQDATKRRLGL